MDPTPILVELSRCRHGGKDEEETAFATMNEAIRYGYMMLTGYSYRVWINGTEYTRKDFSAYDLSQD